MYWGCGTAGNRIQWALFSFLSLCALVLCIVSRIQQNRCQLCDTDARASEGCESLKSDDWNSFDDATQEIRGCSLQMVSGMFLGGIVALLLAIIPICVMGCSKKPDHDQVASHSDLLRQSLQFYVGQPSDITQHQVRSSAAAGNSARYSAIYDAMYN